MSDLLQILDDYCASKGYPKHVGGLLEEANKILQGSGYKNIRNAFQNNGRALILDSIFDIYNKRNLPFEIDFTLDHLQKKNWNSGVLFLTLHGYFSPVLRWYTDANLQLAILADYPAAVRLSAKASGVTQGNILIFKRHNLSLLRMKDFIQKNISVSATIDFRRGNEHNYSFLSETAVSCLKHFTCNTYFILPYLTKENRIEPKILNLNSSLCASKKQDLILGFLQEFNPGSDYRFEKFDYKKRRLELLSKKI